MEEDSVLICWDRKDKREIKFWWEIKFYFVVLFVILNGTLSRTLGRRSGTQGGVQSLVCILLVLLAHLDHSTVLWAARQTHSSSHAIITCDKLTNCSLKLLLYPKKSCCCWKQLPTRTHFLAPLVTNMGLMFSGQIIYKVVIAYQFFLFPV